MKRFHLMLFVCLFLSFGSFAQTNPLVMYGLTDYQLTGLSPNGKWACGTFSNGASALFAFRWDLTTNEIVVLSTGNEETTAFSVSDNGVVVGTFPDKEVTVNKAPVSTAGYWKDGAWHHLETIDGAYLTHPDYGGQALCISRNGEYIGGGLYNKSNRYTPIVWKNGKIYKNFDNGLGGVVKSVSNDGKIAGGWAYTKKSEGTRVPTLWKEGENPHYLINEEDGNFWRAVKNISPNEKYMLFDWSIYDLTKDEAIEVPSISSDPFDRDIYAMTDDKTVVGYESTGEFGSSKYAIIYKDGRTRKLEDYLKEKGVDFSKDGVVMPNPDAEDSYFIVSGVGISEDGKTFGIMFYDKDANSRPMIVKLDQNTTTREPVALESQQLEGIYAAKLVWEAPLSNQEGVKGYNVYRNGTKINSNPVTETHYVDAGLDKNTYSYAVTAIYENAESDQSESSVITIADKKLEAPYNLFARQKGLNNTYLLWNAPMSNLIYKKYYDPEMEIIGFGGGNISFEAAICHDQEEMAHYSGYKITHVSFYPMTPQDKWTINIYSGKKLIYTEDIATELKYKQENCIKLKSAVAIPTGGDVYVAIKVAVPSNVDSNNVIGQVYGEVVPGYSDLVRQEGEPEFYSLYAESQKNGYDFSIAWGISMILSPDGASEDIDKIGQYNIYVNGLKAGSSDSNSYLVTNQSDGKYTYEVEAVYSDDRISDKAATELTVEKNEKVYKSVSNVSVKQEGDNIVAKWEAPLDNDETFISYAGSDAKNSVLGPEENNYGYMAKASYNNSLLRSYGGYQVNSLRFYPLAEADFTFMVNKNGEEICSQFVDNYTVGQWNTVVLEEPFLVEEGADYDLLLDCFDVTPNQAPLAIDGLVPFVGISDSYSINRGETFNSIFGETSAVGNWMIGMLLTTPEADNLPVQGYNVRIDGEKKNDALITDTQFTYNYEALESQTHRMNVDVLYDVVGEVKGDAVFFTLYPTGIEDNEIASIRLFPNPATEYVKVEGGNVESIVAFSSDGKQVEQSDDNILNVSDLDAGLYILKICIDGKEKTAKINVIR